MKKKRKRKRKPKTKLKYRYLDPRFVHRKLYIKMFKKVATANFKLLDMQRALKTLKQALAAAEAEIAKLKGETT